MKNRKKIIIAMLSIDLLLLFSNLIMIIVKLYYPNMVSSSILGCLFLITLLFSLLSFVIITIDTKYSESLSNNRIGRYSKYKKAMLDEKSFYPNSFSTPAYDVPQSPKRSGFGIIIVIALILFSGLCFYCIASYK